MLIIGFKDIDILSFTEKYPDKVVALEYKSEKVNSENLISFIEIIKDSLANYDIVFIPYVNEIILCLDTLAIPYTVAYPTELDKEKVERHKQEYEIFKGLALKHDNLVINVGQSIEDVLKDKFEWVKINNEKQEIKEENQIENQENKQDEKQENNQDEKQENNQDEKQETEKVEDKQDELAVVKTETKPVDKSKLTLQELIEQDIDITEADIRELKSTTNKFKVALMLQAKSRLNTVLKLCGVLDKLYDELINRIDQSLTTTDTPSLMYTTEYISKALADTNQFIMSLITNEKIQNFFIIDNSNIININDNRVDIDKREKIRKAAEIVLDNADYFTNGQYDKIIDPNSVFEVDKDGGENSDGNTST